MNNNIIKRIKVHLGKHKKKTIDRRLKFVHSINHRLIHVEEIIVVLLIGFLSMMLANNVGIPGADQYVEQSSTIQDLQQAIATLKPEVDNKRILTQWTARLVVNNSAYPGYCTHMVRVVSPGIFPYISDTEQKHVFYGNAKDWCTNAQEAGLEIGSMPKKDAIVVYKPGNGYSSYGHVEKVAHINEIFGKMITLGGNRVGKNIYSYYVDSYRDNKNIDCFIYVPDAGKNNVVPKKVLQQIFPDLNMVEELQVVIGNIDDSDLGIDIVAPTEETVEVADVQETPSSVIQNIPEVVVKPQIIVPIIAHESAGDSSSISLDLSKVSDQAKYFLSQWELQIISNVSETNMEVGDIAEITIKLNKEKTQELFAGIMPLPLMLIPTTTNVELDYTYIQLMRNGEATITVKAKKAGETTLLIQFGGVNIAKIQVRVK